jgi:urease accessory protein
MVTGEHMVMTIAIPMRMTTHMTIHTNHLLILQQMLSPAFPVGSFAYSQGLEAAVQAGWVSDAPQTEVWLRDILSHGSAWSDLVLCAHAVHGRTGVRRLDDLARALCLAPERKRETLQQGKAFASAANTTWGLALIPAAYPVVLGQAIVELELPPAASLSALLLAQITAQVSAAQRLVPLGQTEAQSVIAHLSSLCAPLADRALSTELDDIGGFAPLADVAMQRHGGLYSKLFQS